MKGYGINYVNLGYYKLRDLLSGGDIYSDVKEFAKIVMPFIEDYNYGDEMVPKHEYHNMEELIELLESLTSSTYLYVDMDCTSGIVINIYNLVL